MFLINEDITYSPQFSYREYEVIKQNNFRYYKIEDKLVPSVTSILRLSRHNQKDIFSAKQADSFEIGNLMHSYLDKYIKKEEIKTEDSGNSKIALQLCKSIIDNIFPCIDKFIASEATIHEDCNYAGRLDLLAEIDGKLTVVDYKSSFRKKSSYQIDEHFQQLAAYASAHDKIFDTVEICYLAWKKNLCRHYSISSKKSYSIKDVAKMFNTKIERAMIFIAYKDTFEHEVLEADSSSLNTYKDMWIDKLQYYNDVSQ